MLKKILLLSDSFKGSLSSGEIASLGQKYFRKYLPKESVKGFRIADGGEGTVAFFINELGFTPVEITTVNAFLKPIKTKYATKGDVAVFDVASVVGFDVNDGLDIMHATTYGIGLVLDEIINAGYQKIYLGLGGSITNDGGSGLLAIPSSSHRTG